MDFVTSDLHINHANIISHSNRPFAGVEEMNNALIDNWNNTVSDSDRVFVVGDFLMGPKSEWADFIAMLNGHIVLVMGNHDIASGKHTTPAQNKKWMLECGVDEAVDEYYYEDTKHKLVYWMNHFPPEGVCRYSDNRGYVRPKATRNYDILLHGHTHSHEMYTKKDVIHVGVDSHGFVPISFDTMYEIVQNQPKY